MSSLRIGVTSSITEDEINDLVNKLHDLLPHFSSSNTKRRASASKSLKEICSYIKRLQGEVDNLSANISHLLSSMDSDDFNAHLLTSISQP